MAPLWRHASTFHSGTKEVAWYEMKVVRKHRTPLNRQVDEGVEIALCKADIVINSKGEWNGSKLPRMIVERGDQVEVDPGDVNVRMMNWDTRPKQNQFRSAPVKRKDFSSNEENNYVSEGSDRESVTTEGKDTERLEVQPRKKKRMDCRIQEVKPRLITSFFEQATRK